MLLNKSNLKLMRMICNLKFGFLDANTDNFGYNCQGTYDDFEERKEMSLYSQLLSKILRANHQLCGNFTVRMFFKIIDEGSK